MRDQVGCAAGGTAFGFPHHRHGSVPFPRIVAEAQRQLNLLSVVAPVFDEEDTLEEFYRRVTESLAAVPIEIVLVDDGSSDASPALLEALAQRDPRVRVLTLSRNFGHQAAITAGLDEARGDAVVILDADLQDPPEVIPQMLERWREGAEVVYGVRRLRSGESRSKLVTARWFYKLFARLAQIDLRQNSGDFRLLGREAHAAVRSMRERSRFVRGMTVWVGFEQAAVEYERDQRFAGQTKYTLRRMLRFSVDALSSFSHVPLQAATVLGFTFSMIAFLGIPVAIGIRIAGEFVPGITTVLLAVLLLGGIQLITVGIIGEYLARIYDEVKQRPLYIVRGRSSDPQRDPRDST